jgi:hypothetical protein
VLEIMVIITDCAARLVNGHTEHNSIRDLVATVAQVVGTDPTTTRAAWKVRVFAIANVQVPAHGGIELAHYQLNTDALVHVSKSCEFILSSLFANVAEDVLGMTRTMPKKTLRTSNATQPAVAKSHQVGAPLVAMAKDRVTPKRQRETDVEEIFAAFAVLISVLRF